jgi:hypothetical protein
MPRRSPEGARPARRPDRPPDPRSGRRPGRPPPARARRHAASRRRGPRSPRHRGAEPPAARRSSGRCRSAAWPGPSHHGARPVGRDRPDPALPSATAPGSRRHRQPREQLRSDRPVAPVPAPRAARRPIRHAPRQVRRLPPATAQYGPGPPSRPGGRSQLAPDRWSPRPPMRRRADARLRSPGGRTPRVDGRDRSGRSRRANRGTLRRPRTSLARTPAHAPPSRCAPRARSARSSRRSLPDPHRGPTPREPGRSAPPSSAASASGGAPAPRPVTRRTPGSAPRSRRGAAAGRCGPPNPPDPARRSVGPPGRRTPPGARPGPPNAAPPESPRSPLPPAPPRRSGPVRWTGPPAEPRQVRPPPLRHLAGRRRLARRCSLQLPGLHGAPTGVRSRGAPAPCGTAGGRSRPPARA